MAKRQASAAHLFKGSYPLTLDGIEQARDELGLALKRGISGKTSILLDVGIVVGEVLQNIIRHERSLPGAKPGFAVLVTRQDEALYLDILDNAAPLADTDFLQKEHEAGVHGGMGLGIIHEVVEAYAIEPQARGNRHRLLISLDSAKSQT